MRQANKTNQPGLGKNLVSGRKRPVERYLLVLTGVTRLLTDPMGDDTLKALRTGEKMPIDKTRSLEERCKGKLYLDDDGKITMPAANLLAALNYAGKFMKYDAKKSIATGTSSLVPSFLTMRGEFLKFTYDKWQPDQRRGRLEATGVAVAVVRPKFFNWSVEVEIEIDVTPPITFETVLQLFEYAGRVSGLGSFRPSCKGEFGKFNVTECYRLAG